MPTEALISTLLWSARRQTRSSTSSSCARCLDTYGLRDGDDAEQGDGGSVVRKYVWTPRRRNRISTSRLANIHTYRVRFSSKISGRLLAEPYIRGVYKIAKQWLGDRVYFWVPYKKPVMIASTWAGKAKKGVQYDGIGWGCGWWEYPLLL
jgi:hypothetical protein